MNTRSIARLAAACIAAIGCLVAGVGCSTPSLSAVYAPDKSDVVQNAGLVGAWCTPDDAKKPEAERTTYTVTETKQVAYLLSVKPQADNKDMHPSSYDLHLVKMGDMLLADLYPSKESREQVGSTFGMTMLPVHVFLRIEISPDSLRLWQTDTAVVDDLLTADEGTTPSAPTDDYRVMTGPNKQVRAFIEKHAKEPKFWSKELPLTRIKPAR